MRERARIDEVVSDYVTLKHAGGGSQKGLCPFHDEKSPSFNVNPSKNFFHCFGCGEGGDVIAFLMKIEGLSFTEAVERLADKYGVQLRYQEGSATAPAEARAATCARGCSRRTRPRRPSTSSSSPPPTRRRRGVPRPARLRPGRRRDVRGRVRAARRRRPLQAPAAEGLQRRGARHRRPGRQGSAATTTGSAAGCCGRSVRPTAT